MTITSRIILKNKNTENEQRQEAREITLNLKKSIKGEIRKWKM